MEKNLLKEEKYQEAWKKVTIQFSVWANQKKK